MSSEPQPKLKRHSLLTGGLAIAVFFSAIVVNQSSLLAVRQLKDNAAFATSTEVIYVPDIRQMRLMTLGYNQAAADFVWIRTLEYFARHFKGDRKYPWLEHFLNQIVALDPDFTKVYHWAGANVLYGRRFTNENVRRSNRYYELALKQNPDDYEAAYRLGLNHYVELKSNDPDESRKNRELGLAYFERAANTPGAPDRVRSLVASISSRLGKHQLALQYLVDLFTQTQDVEQRQSILGRIEALKKNIGDASIADDAMRFQAQWQENFPYIPASLYSILGEPTAEMPIDRGWRSLLSDIAISTSIEDDGTGHLK